MRGVRPIDLSVYSSESVETEVDGTTYRGIRFFKGTRDVRQEIHFEDLRQVDPKHHRTSDVRRMRAIARVILRELVEQRRAQGASRLVKVKPSKGETREPHPLEARARRVAARSFRRRRANPRRLFRAGTRSAEPRFRSRQP